MRDAYFPFRALGLRSNPFRALTDEEWAEIVILPQAVTAAAAHGGHLQVLGEFGRGKTSTLLGLAAQWRASQQQVAYEYLPSGQDTFSTPLIGLDVFLLDEAQRLRPAERRRLLASVTGSLRLVLGSHADLTRLFEAAGLALSTVRLGSLDRAHLEAILARRLDFFAVRPGQPAVSFDPGALQYLEITFGSNLRAMERFLYEVFQSLETPLVLTSDHLRAHAATVSAPARR